MNRLDEQEHDITKKMIDVMRNGSKATTVIKEEDITKKMLNTIRNGKTIITEDMSNQVPMGGNQLGDSVGQSQQNQSAPSEAEDLDENSLKNEQKAFMDSVSPKVSFNEFKIYRKERNVVFSGVFQDLGGMEWVMSLKDSDGLNITAQSLKVDKDSIQVLNKLHGFYLNWSKEWAIKLNTEYSFKG